MVDLVLSRGFVWGEGRCVGWLGGAASLGRGGVAKTTRRREWKDEIHRREGKRRGRGGKKAVVEWSRVYNFMKCGGGKVTFLGLPYESILSLCTLHQIGLQHSEKHQTTVTYLVNAVLHNLFTLLFIDYSFNLKTNVKPQCSHLLTSLLPLLQEERS